MSHSVSKTLIVVALLNATYAQAQFKKYRSKTTFNESSSSTPAAQAQPMDAIPTESTAVAPAVPSGDDEDEDEDEEGASAPPPTAGYETEEAEGEVFGRNGETQALKGPNANKYVNLNPETSFGPEIIQSFDFPNADIMDITKHMQKLTGINLILDKDVKGKVSIVAPSPITVGDAWKAYLTALNMNGYSIVKAGAFYKVVNNRDIRYTPTKIYTGGYTPDTDNYVMRVQPLKNISAAEISRNFRPFLTRYGRMIEIKQTNTVILSDTGSNINRIVKMIKFLDVPGHDESLQIIKVKNSSADEIAKLLDSILKDRSNARFRNNPDQKAQNISKIIAEKRTNSIIAMANADGAKELRTLIDKLDVKLISSSSGQVHVYYLYYGDAETLAKTLTTLTSTTGTSAASRFTSPGSTTSQGLFSSQVKVAADKANNALVVTAAPTDYLTIKEVIAKLDIPRDQVYVEGLIMETNVAKDRAFGVSILGAYGSGAAQQAGFTGGSSDLISLMSRNYTSLGGLFVGGGAGPKVQFTPPGGQAITVNSVNGLISAVATDTSTNVLATPQILAMDNTQAVFEVGETVPIQESSQANNGATNFSIKEQKVALTLKITPQINKVTRFVKLKIDQKIDDFSNRKTATAQGVATTTRSAVTEVIVRDRDTIAMGGLMRDKENITENKIPLLGDIPVLGWLFKNKSRQVDKVNLLLFLTPKILNTYEKTAAATTKDVLNRRSAHLKNLVGENDPFASTVKGIYQKADRQELGPLYDKEDGERYQRMNEQAPPQEEHTEELIMNDKTVPDYQSILKKVEAKKRGEEVKIEDEQPMTDIVGSPTTPEKSTAPQTSEAPSEEVLPLTN
ncbi:MAG: type II secretion system secretin GspD [Bacteriovoracaceae bacterium]